MSRDWDTTVSVMRDRFVFSAAHFAQLPDGTSEPLHGHNYTVRVHVSGNTDDTGFLCSFADVKDAVMATTSVCNQRTLLPLESSRLSIVVEGDYVDVVADGRQYRFPVADVALLPISNTTCECLAAFIGQQVAERLAPLHVGVEVAEDPGQAALWSMPEKGRTP